MRRQPQPIARSIRVERMRGSRSCGFCGTEPVTLAVTLTSGANFEVCPRCALQTDVAHTATRRTCEVCLRVTPFAKSLVRHGNAMPDKRRQGQKPRAVALCQDCHAPLLAVMTRRDLVDTTSTTDAVDVLLPGLT